MAIRIRGYNRPLYGMRVAAGSLLTEANLAAGINVWLTKKTNWPRDFHNEFYQGLFLLKQNGLNSIWWLQVVDYLSGWRALRPLTKKEIHARGVKCLGKLQAAHDRITSSTAAQALNLATANWETLEELFTVASGIKGVRSPVFGSKLCHFMLPDAFPVIDLDVIRMGPISYDQYWQFCRVLWAECSDREALKQKLQHTIGKIVHPNYPFTTKVTELCIIGSHASHP